MASGQRRTIKVDNVPAPFQLVGPWEVGFDTKWGGPKRVIFPQLQDWAQRPENGIRHYSGKASYQKRFTWDLSSQTDPRNSTLILDLGKVAVMAEVRLNGKDLGILWKPPFRVDVTDTIKSGENLLEVKVVNLWINRMIGDEQLPEDSQRNANGTLKAWPQWVNEGKSSPAGRYTFTSWRLWKKDSPLVESGLLGPVVIQIIPKHAISAL